MTREPFLDVDLTDDNGRNLHVGLRSENVAVVAAALTGYAVSNLKSRRQQLYWSRILYKKMHELIYDNKTSEYLLLKFDKGISLPVAVMTILQSKKFEKTYERLNNGYVLSIVDPFSFNSHYSYNCSSRVLKFAYTTRMDSQHIDQNKQKSSFLVALKNLLLPLGPSYIISLPQFGNGYGACHARVYCPVGMIIDDVGLISGDKKELTLQDAAGNTEKRLQTRFIYKYEDECRAEIIYDKIRAEFLDHALPASLNQDKNTDSVKSWQVKLTLNPKRGELLIPGLCLLLISFVVILSNRLSGYRYGDLFNASSLASLILPLAAGIIIVRQEHAVLARSVILARFLIGASSFFCILSGIISTVRENGSSSVPNVLVTNPSFLVKALTFWIPATLTGVAILYIIAYVTSIQMLRYGQGLKKWQKGVKISLNFRLLLRGVIKFCFGAVSVD